MKWQSPPAGEEKALFRLHEAYYCRDPLRLPASCEICSHPASCHIYYHRPKAGNEFGGGWIWCSACYSYEHFSMRIPNWWQNPEFIVFEQLQHDPEYLDAHAVAIDKHCAQFLLNQT